MIDSTTAVNLAELSDDEIATMDPDSLDSSNEEPSPAEEVEATDEAESTASDDDGDNAAADTGGAEAAEDSPKPVYERVGDTAADLDVDLSDGVEPEPEPEQQAEGHQPEASDTPAEEKAESKSEEANYEAMFNEVMSPFKAAKRTVTPKNVDDVRRLMQMGVDYTRKMEMMKPYQRVLKTLEKANLIDPDKINFLIDLDQKNPEAIKKFLKDSEIDPMDLSLEEGGDYKPTDHTISDQEMGLEDVLTDIRDTETFDRTARVITEEWDTASKSILRDNPEVIRIINDHMQVGIYDQIMERVTNERTFGRLTGLSDLEAYKAVGDAIHSEGGFNAPQGDGPAPAGNTDQGFSQDSGSSSAEAENLRNRKKAASPTKGSASPGKKKVDLSKLTDEQIEQMDPLSLI